MQQKENLKNLTVVLLSLFVTFVILETALRVTNLATDLAFVEGDEELGFKLIPNQTGTYVVGTFGENKAPYHINSDGWNAIRDYKEKRDQTINRIAVIGDSFVEAFQVPPRAAMPAVLERGFLRTNAVEVYSFGISGASLSHYLAIMRYVRNRFAPDLYIINIVHNDFLESLETADRAIFHSVRPAGDTYEEVRPKIYHPSAVRRIIGHSAIARYFFVNLKIRQKMRIKFRPIAVGGEYDDRQFEANIDVAKIDVRTMKEVVEYLFKKYLQEVDEDREKLVLVIDSPRQPIYEETHPKTTAAFKYNKLTTEICRDLLLYCLDLTDHFWSDFQQNRRRFNSVIDGHWNAYGHEEVGKQIEYFLIKNGLLSMG